MGESRFRRSASLSSVGKEADKIKPIERCLCAFSFNYRVTKASFSIWKRRTCHSCLILSGGRQLSKALVGCCWWTERNLGVNPADCERLRAGIPGGFVMGLRAIHNIFETFASAVGIWRWIFAQPVSAELSFASFSQQAEISGNVLRYLGI